MRLGKAEHGPHTPTPDRAKIYPGIWRPFDEFETLEDNSSD
jgi:hypothetical protein